MAKLDIEEKFKKDISKEVANLKEFLISQGKEIVKPLESAAQPSLESH